MIGSIDSALYSMLPGPRAFMHRIASGVHEARHLVINHPNSFTQGLRETVKRGLQDAHIESVIVLNIQADADVADNVGVHFGHKRVTGAVLAGISGSAPIAVVLIASGEQAQELCQAYAADFRGATGHSQGVVRLVNLMQDPLLKSSPCDGESKIITFDGGLNPQEMAAYISFRMVNRPGFGSTGLLRGIVTEFAGFDAEFAERLMLMDCSQLLGIKDCLEMLMEEDPARWRYASWLSGSESTCTAMPHVLHDCYVAKYSQGTHRDLARKRVEARYWCACVKEITPWIEERRHDVLSIFHPQLRKIAAAHPSGFVPIPSPPRADRLVKPEDVETNNIVGMARGGILSITNDNEKMALSVCKLIKPVRDDIAHLRAPTVTALSDLVRGVDNWKLARQC
jgi:hypothetical protein